MSGPAAERLYLDTSAIVALYTREQHTAAARTAVASARELLASQLAYPEARAALSAQRRGRRLTRSSYVHALASLERDWQILSLAELDATVASAAGALAEAHSLKGADAVHLASALAFGSQPGGAVLLTFDRDLIRAARAAGLTVYEASGP